MQDFSPTLNFAGKDNFQWWIGQVTDPNKGKWDKARNKVKLDSNEEIYSYRCRVRIIGYHDCAGDLPDDQLPLAHVLVPPNAQNGAGEGSTFNYQGGEVVVGFFIDGADAQQPVVFGSLFKQDFLADTLTNDEYSKRKEVCFQPWTPPGAKQNIHNHAKKKDRVQEKKLGYNSTQNNGESDDSNKAIQQSLLDIESDDATPCENTQISKIREAVERFIKKLKGLQKILDGYVDPVLGKLVNLNEDIKFTAGLVFDAMTNLIRRARTWIVEQILQKLSRFLRSIVPAPLHKVTGKAIKTIVDLIVCIFEKIIKQLFQYITDSIGNLIDKVIDVPQCAIENFLGNMLGQLYGVLDSTLGPMLSQINNIVGGALGKASSIISKGLQYANLFLSILNCDKLQCRPPRKWRNASGPTNEQIDNFKNALSKASLASIAAEKLKTVNDMVKADATAPDCSTNVLRCGPPRIDFVGGGGSLASGKAVISAVGNLIGVALDNSGFGFTSPPLITFYDSCGNGYGGYGQSIIGPVSVVSTDDDGNPVYAPDPNGTETGVTMIEIINEGGGYLPNTTETTLNDDGTITTTVVIPDQNSNTDSENSYVLEIQDVIVDETGYLYSDTDTVTVLSCDGITPDTSGAEIKLTIIEGYIVKARVLNGGSGFTCLPELRINSDTGVGATLTPVMKFTRVEDAKQIASTTQDAVVTVIDCVQR